MLVSPLSSRLARSLVAAASLFLAAPPALAASPVKDADAATTKKHAGDKADKKDGAAVGKTDKKDAARADKRDAAAGKKDPSKVEKTDKKDAAAGKLAKKDDPKKDAIKGPASIGAPNKGKLSGAIKLHSSRSLKVRERSQAWALPDLVKLLQRAAGKVAKKYPKSVMLVGDMSSKSGGPMTGHHSHQSGRDADVGFYIANSKGKPAVMTRFVAFDGAGKSAQVSWAQFDDARNWALVEALLTDTTTPVRYIFVSNPLRARVLAHAAKQKVAKDLHAKAQNALLAPRDADVHDDHFHVRIACPESMKGTCVEESFGQPAPARPAAKAAVAKSDAKPAGGDDAKPAANDPKPAAEPAPQVAAAPAAPANGAGQ
jgi:penicillin-insensitive murein DD-endopeptidase